MYELKDDLKFLVLESIDIALFHADFWSNLRLYMELRCSNLDLSFCNHDIDLMTEVCK